MFLTYRVSLQKEIEKDNSERYKIVPLLWGRDKGGISE
jgi:hypothetical protein